MSLLMRLALSALHQPGPGIAMEEADTPGGKHVSNLGQPCSPAGPADGQL